MKMSNNCETTTSNNLVKWKINWTTVWHPLTTTPVYLSLSSLSLSPRLPLNTLFYPPLPPLPTLGHLLAHISWSCVQSNSDLDISGYKVLVDGKQYGTTLHAGVKNVRIKVCSKYCNREALLI